ncbi:hypothetical protein P280DRAFT_210893 [Massarina eburnea CBS 473.64]|uniref:Uncharacterized protein n=1 Tax=Massarina eburnea CBS 473.64 TaxID=1395130 RepID=A0A6A6RHV2_9PLEO|nr:hypothetical protein P280DRAFT_210893 [Massarina eburnea CBS 473.64]
MPHERDFAVRPSVGVAWPNRGEEDPQAPHLTVDTDMSSDYPNDYGNELERGQQLPHERSLSAIESVPEEKVDSTSNPASPAFGRPGFNSFTFRPSRSCLPHSMPRSDDEDPYLKGNLELFPSNREGIYQQIERTESLVPEDVPEKACFATELSATELSAVASHTSLTAIVEIREQEEEEEEESSSDPSSPLEFGRNVQARKNPLATLYGPLNDANTSARNEASGADRSSTAHHDTYDGTSAGGVASKGSHAGDLMGMDGLTTSASADDNSALHPLTLSTSAHNKNEDDATSDSGSEDSIQSADVITTTPPPHSPIVVDHAQGAEPTVPESENSATAFPIDGEKTTNVSEKQKYTSVTESSPITPATAKNNKGTANNPHRDDLISAMVGSDAKLGERMYSDLTTPAPPQEPTTKPERGGRFAGMLGAVRRLVVACFGTGSH